MRYKPKTNDDEFADYATQDIISTGDIYRNHTVPTMQMLAKKIVKGNFDHDLAIKGIISGIIDPSLPTIKREYNEYDSGGSNPYYRVSMETKIAIAKELLAEYRELLQDIVNDLKKSKRIVKKKIVKKTRKV